MRIWLAFRAFFRALFDSEAAKAIDSALSGKLPISAGPPPAEAAPKVTAPKPAQPQRSEAVTLLATLQREARFVDLVMERLESYSDAQVGAAARDVLRDCGKVLERLFDLKPVSRQEEESPFEVTEGYDPGSIRLVGNVEGEPPFTGKLVHHGWIASRIELPKWTGSESSEAIVAPAEVEVK
jgi:hypothetical protein